MHNGGSILVAVFGGEHLCGRLIFALLRLLGALNSVVAFLGSAASVCVSCDVEWEYVGAAEEVLFVHPTLRPSNQIPVSLSPPHAVKPPGQPYRYSTCGVKRRPTMPLDAVRHCARAGSQ